MFEETERDKINMEGICCQRHQLDKKETRDVLADSWLPDVVPVKEVKELAGLVHLPENKSLVQLL